MRHRDGLRGRLAACAVSSLLLLSACATGRDSVDAAQRRGPLPFHVGIYVATAEGLEEAALGEGPARGVRFRLGASDLADALARELERSPRVVSLASPLSASSLEEAIEAARRENADYVVALDFRTAPRYDLYRRPLGWASLEIASWLFGGVPAWFVPTVHYVTDTTLEAKGLDPGGAVSGSPPASSWEETLKSESRGTSLWDRSDIRERPLDYVATIVVPPMLMTSGSPERLARELTDSTLLDVSGKLRECLRRRLTEVEENAPLSVVFLSPAPARRLDANSVRMRVAISSLDGGEIRAMDVIRLAEGAELFRWAAPREELARLSEGLRALAGTGGYFEYIVPSEIPLEYGENIVKVRFLLQDRRVLTRTAVYLR